MHNSEKGVLKGPKLRGKHATYIEAAEPFIKAAKKSIWVDKLILGRIESCKAGNINMKFSPTPSGLKVTFRGPCAVQEFFITTDQREWAQEDLTKAMLDD